MFVPKTERKWSGIGLKALVISTVAALVLAFADGLIKAYAVAHMSASAELTLFSSWVLDFRYVAEQAITAAAILFVGAKFIETRTIFTIGFDKLDHENISLKGPDENNVVWVGHHYGTKLEAEAISAALSERLKKSAVAEADT
jgi:hypothetical protein